MKTVSPPTPPSLLLPRLHLALTAFLGLALVGLLGLLGAGRLTWKAEGVSGANQAGENKQSEDPGKAKNVAAGRFRIEPIDADGKVLAQATQAGFFSFPCSEVRVFKYQGGYLECRVEAGKGEDKVKLVTVPENWPQLLRNEPALLEGKAELPFKEGYLVATVLASPPDARAVRYAPYLGGFLAAGPGGPASLLPWPWLSSSSHREIGLLLTAGSPEGEAGPGFRVHTTRRFTLPFPLVPDAPEMQTRRVGKSLDLTPGATIPLVEWEWGETRLSLVAGFLTQGELNKHAQAGAGKEK